MLLDMNHQSGFVYGHSPDAGADTATRINTHVDAALVARNSRQRPRDYLGGSRVGERLAALPHAPIYVFPDQVAFDSDAVDLMSRQILTGPLQLPHSDVIFEVGAP